MRQNCLKSFFPLDIDSCSEALILAGIPKLIDIVFTDKPSPEAQEEKEEVSNVSKSRDGVFPYQPEQ